jgi:hypothetical protein
MIEYNHLPNSIDVQRYDATNGTDWVSWNKPRNARFIRFFAVGGGGGGGGGSNSGSLGYGFGGGGGGGGAVTTVFVPAFLVPDTLYVQVGLGGAGGTSGASTGTGGAWAGGTAGIAGGSTIIAITNTGGGTLVIGGGGAGGGATTVTNSYNGGGGGAGVGSSFFGPLALVSYVTGGASGTIPPNDITAASPNVNVTSFGTTGGGAGGNMYVIAPKYNHDGASIVFPDLSYLAYTNIVGGLSTDTGNLNAANGILFSKQKPFISSGGAGGGANGSGGIGAGRLGGNGGNGALGSGGGGSGGNTYYGSVGSCYGGSGGNGFAIITSY